MTRIKICGITRVEDALAAVRSGADAIGLVFYEPSSRHVSVVHAAHLAGSLPPFVTTVGLFVNAEARSEERRVGKECSRTCRSRWSPYH